MTKIIIVARDSVPKANPAGLVAYRYASLFGKYREVKLISIISPNGSEIPSKYIDASITIKNIYLTKNKFVNIFKYCYVFIYIFIKFILCDYKTLFTHTNPLYTHFYGILLKVCTFGKVRWIASFTDPYSNSPFERRGFISFGVVVRKIEQKIVLKLSDYMVFVTNTMKDYILNKNDVFSQKSLVIPFFYLDDLKDKIIINHMKSDIKKIDIINLIHPGSIYGNRTAEHLFNAIRALSFIKLSIYGNVNNYEGDMPSNVVIKPSVDYDQLILEISKNDYVLIVDSFFDEIDNPYMPSKVIDAMYLDKPIIGVTDVGTELDVFLRKTNNSSTINDTDEIIKMMWNLDAKKADYSFFSEKNINQILKNKIIEILK